MKENPRRTGLQSNGHNSIGATNKRRDDIRYNKQGHARKVFEARSKVHWKDEGADRVF